MFHGLSYKSVFKILEPFCFAENLWNLFLENNTVIFIDYVIKENVIVDQ